MAGRKATLASWAAHERRTETDARLGRIADLLKRANNPMDTVGQSHASQQLARVDVPWLLGYVKELEQQNNVTTPLGLVA